MRRFILLIVIILGFTIVCKAQDGYQITGKASGLPDSTTLLLTTGENGKLDTLNTVRIKNGVFIFKGKVDAPMAVSLATTDGKVSIPLILENVPFMINVSERGALIQGGEQQEIFGQFNRISTRLLQEQERIQSAYTRADQSGNKSEMESLMKQFEGVIAVARKEEKVLREKYSDKYVTAYVVTLGMRGDTEESLRAKYEALGEIARATVPGKRIAATLNQYLALKEGGVAPDFTAYKSDGNTFTLYGLSGKLKLLYFWTSENVASRQDTPELVKLYLQYRPLGLEIISISLDENVPYWRHAVGLDGMIWTNGSDLKGFDSEIARLYLVNDVPYTILIDGENRIVAKNLRGKNLQKKVGELLKKGKKK